MQYRAARMKDGSISQSALKKTAPHENTARSMLLRGVVIHTYYVDDLESLPRPQATPSAFSNRNPTGVTFDVPTTEQRHIYCDVLVYSGLHGMKKSVITRALVAQHGGGVHTGEIWVPRPATINMNGGDLSSQLTRINPGDLDGDHVLVGFIDDDRHTPVIVGSVPHPSRDRGVDAKGDGSQGTRLKKPADGTLNLPRLTKHNGIVFGVDENGNYVANLARAHKGLYDPDGNEPRLPGDPSDSSSALVPDDGTSGNYEVVLRAGSRVVFSVITDPANLTDPSIREATLSIEDGKIVLAVESNGNDPGAQPASVTLENKKITIDGWDDGQVIVNAQLLDVQADQVVIGNSATEHVILGDSWQAAQGSYDSALVGILTNILAVLTAAGTTFPLPAQATLVALTAAATAQLATLSSALESPALLSTSVTARG